MADYIKLPEVARRLGISEKTARRMVKAGQLPALFIGNSYRVREEDLQGYLRSAKVTPGKAPAPPSQASFNNLLAEERRLRPWITYVSRRVEWREKIFERKPDEEFNNPWLSLETAIQWAVNLAVESADLRGTIKREVLNADSLTDEADELRELLDRFVKIERRTDERVNGMMEDAGLAEGQKRARLKLIHGERDAS